MIGFVFVEIVHDNAHEQLQSNVDSEENESVDIDVHVLYTAHTYLHMKYRL